MKTIKVDLGQLYHTQRDNNIRPGITCASTSMAMALFYAGYGEELAKLVPAEIQAEDFITGFIHSDPRVIEFWSNHPQRWIRDAYLQYKQFVSGNRAQKETVFGNEIHEVMEFAINTIFDYPIDSFSYAMPISSILDNLIKGGCATLSGRFPSQTGSIGHIVCLTGFDTTQENIEQITDELEIDVDAITGFWIDDPYGDYRTRYASKLGNDILMPRADFFAMINESGVFTAKRSHVIVPFASRS